MLVHYNGLMSKKIGCKLDSVESLWNLGSDYVQFWVRHALCIIFFYMQHISFHAI